MNEAALEQFLDRRNVRPSDLAEPEGQERPA